MGSYGVVIRNQYRKEANIKKYIIQYSSRENATQAIYPMYEDGHSKKLEKEYDFLDGLAFDDQAISLDRKSLITKANKLQKKLEETKDTCCMQMILSFSNEYLLKHRIIDKAPNYRGDLFEQVDELKLRYAVKNAMNRYQKSISEDSSWVGCLQFDTLHAHVHIAMVAGEKKYVTKKEKTLIRDEIDITLDGIKQYEPYHNRRREFKLEKKLKKEKEKLVEVKDAVSLQRYISGDIHIDNYIQEIQYNHGKRITLISDSLRKRITDDLNHYTLERSSKVSEKLTNIPKKLNARIHRHLVRAYDYWRGVEAYRKQVENNLRGKGARPSLESEAMKEFYQQELIYELKCVEKYRKFLPVSTHKMDDRKILEKRENVLKVAYQNGDLVSDEINFLGSKSNHKLTFEEIDMLRKDDRFSEDMLDNQRIKKDMSNQTRLELFEYESMLKKRAKVGFVKRIFGAATVEDSFSSVTDDGFLKYPSRKKDSIYLDIDAAELGTKPKNREKWVKNSQKRLSLYERAREYLSRTNQIDPLVERCANRMQQLRNMLYTNLGIKKKYISKEYTKNSTISLSQAKKVAKQHAKIVMKESDYDVEI